MYDARKTGLMRESRACRLVDVLLEVKYGARKTEDRWSGRLATLLMDRWVRYDA